MAHRIQFPNGFYTPFVNFEWLIKYYDKLKCLGYELYPNFDEFVYHYTDPHSLVIQGPGIVIRVQGVDSAHMGYVHGFVYGREVFRCLDGMKELPHLVMGEYCLHRLESEIPETHRGVGRLLEKIGFNKDGYLRNRGRRGTIIYDTIIYSITR